LVRSKAGWLLGMARNSVANAEAAYRRTSFGTPTRDKPFPDASVMVAAQTLERLAARIGMLSGRLPAQPVPENDRMTQRFRSEADTLKSLIRCDERMVGQCALLHAMLDTREAGWMLDHQIGLEEALAAIEDTLRRREAALLGRAE